VVTYYWYWNQDTEMVTTIFSMIDSRHSSMFRSIRKTNLQKVFQLIHITVAASVE
jgi:hypothetical protein